MERGEIIVITINLHWWYIPIVLLILAGIVVLNAKPTSDYDFVTPLLAVVIAIALVVGAGLFMLGRWFA
jgi:hypothetical protein